MGTTSMDGQGPGETRSKELTFLALGVGVLGTLLCASVLYRTAQLPEGDGTGMQWVVLGPIAILFFGVVVPALIIGVSGLRARRALGSTTATGHRQGLARSPVEDIQQQEARAFGVLLKVIVALLVLVFGVLPLVTGLILAIVE